MRVVLAPFPTVPEAVRNLRSLADLANEYGQWGCDLLLTGEGALTSGLVGTDPTDAAQRAWRLDGPQVARVRAIAQQTRLHVGVGFLEADGEAIHSSFLLTDRTGATLGYQRRLLFGEESTPSPPHSIFTLAEKRCIIGLGEDLADQAPTLSAATPDVVLWPRCVRRSRDEWAEALSADATNAAHIYAAALMVSSATDGSMGAAAWFRRGKIKAHTVDSDTPLVADVL